MKKLLKILFFILTLCVHGTSFSNETIWKYGEGTYYLPYDFPLLFGAPMPVESTKEGLKLQLLTGGDEHMEFITKESPIYKKMWFVDKFGRYNRECIVKYQQESCVSMFFMLDKKHDITELYIHAALKSVKKTDSDYILYFDINSVHDLEAIMKVHITPDSPYYVNAEKTIRNMKKHDKNKTLLIYFDKNYVLQSYKIIKLP